MIQTHKHDTKNETFSFVTDMPISLLNAIRRSVLEIPTLGIDEVEIYKNDSALYDEIVAHRLGLVPLKTMKTSKKEQYKLVARGPTTVYSSDLSPSVGTPYKLPLVMLDEGQEIEMVAQARMGTGIEHIKYVPGIIYYRHNVDADVLDFVFIDEGGTVHVDEEELIAKGVPADQIAKIKKVKNVSDLLCMVESWGQLPAKDIFSQAIDVLDGNLKVLAKAVK